jgi:large subunit ribosomal protein L23
MAISMQEVLIRPLITEKGTVQQESGKYTFAISSQANKNSVKQAVEKTFNVKVIDVNICVNRGKAKRYGPRMMRTPDMKKAIVTLRPGDKIQLIEGL